MTVLHRSIYVYVIFFLHDLCVCSLIYERCCLSTSLCFLVMLLLICLFMSPLDIVGFFFGLVIYYFNSFFFFKQKKAYEMRISYWSSDVCSSDLSHTDDSSIPLEETLGAFSDLIKAGKVRAIGASNYSAERFEEALRCSKLNGLASYTTVQPLYNLMERATFEEKLQQICLSHQIGVIPYYSLASGFLTGKYRTPDDLARHARDRKSTRLNSSH